MQFSVENIDKLRSRLQSRIKVRSNYIAQHEQHIFRKWERKLLIEPDAQEQKEDKALLKALDTLRQYTVFFGE